MAMTGAPVALVASVAAGAFFNVALVLQARRLRAVQEQPLRLRIIPAVLLDAGWLAATALAGASFLLELFALHRLPLVVVMPILAAGIIVLPLLGKPLLGEARVAGWQLPSAIVVVGVLLVTAGAGRATGHAALTPATSGLLLGLTVVAAMVTARFVRTGIIVALVAGGAFGVSGTFARIVATTHPGSTPWLLAGAGLVATGLAGFALEMLAVATTSPARVGPVVLVLTALVPIAAEQAWFGATLSHPVLVGVGVPLVLVGAALIAARLPAPAK